MNLLLKSTLVILIFMVFSIEILNGGRLRKSTYFTTTPNRYTRKFCIQLETMIRAKSKSCFLRPDTGPCRAGIVQWYYDAQRRKCYRFFWGGCQGNGNRFETFDSCHKYCHLNTSDIEQRPIPQFCQLGFDYGTCFGFYNRWTYDKFSKGCKMRLYSGCGGNQNNFEHRDQCQSVCARGANNSLPIYHGHTTCIPIHLPAIL